ncbi:MAG: CDP-glycerol glycerophosphotransferase family protein [Spirochaetes bacterium]|nr:CDP-glycerol glycerophosphotransferase family protein [Spirochaetota bacterium]
MIAVIEKFVMALLKRLRIIPNTFLIIESSHPSGSNTKILYDTLRKKYPTDIIFEKDLIYNNKKIVEYLKNIKLRIKMSKYHVILCSHGINKFNQKQLLVDLWHGIPLKSLGFMENKNIYSESRLNADYFITTSKFASVLFSACLHVPFAVQRILGSPRNDHFFPGNVQCELLNHFSKYKKILLYMPTYRQGFQDRIEGEIAQALFVFKDFSEEKFINFLEENNYLFVLKLHPFEEKYMEKIYSKYDKSILFLSTEKLQQNEVDLYQLLPYTDMLITDYSSVYFDYLLLDKPMVFINSDIETYRKLRGIILEPYDFWTPGYKVQTQREMIDAINKSFVNDDFRLAREQMRDVFHYHKDGKSAERVIEFIEEILHGKIASA